MILNAPPSPQPSPSLGGRGRQKRERGKGAGFTLLEVMVALAILGVAVVTMIQLTSQSLRLIKAAGDHQHAVLLADRLLREATPRAEQSEGGQEGPFAWERRATAVPAPEQAARPGVKAPQLLAVSVIVHWAGNHSVEAATLRAVPAEALAR